MSEGHAEHFVGRRRETQRLLPRLSDGELQTVILTGLGGAGKSTLLRILNGEIRPDAGTIRFRGESLAGLPPHRIVDGGIARTFQNIRLFRDLTVLDNVRAAHFGRTPTSIWSAQKVWFITGPEVGQTFWSNPSRAKRP